MDMSNFDDDAENDLNEFLEYLLFEKQSEQAAKNLLDDLNRQCKLSKWLQEV